MSADTFIQKTKKLYIDTRTQRNMAKLTEDISEVHSIMTKNIQDVLNHGERLDSKLTSALCFDSLHTCKSVLRRLNRVLKQPDVITKLMSLVITAIAYA